jgi:hypothetical protein
MLLEINRIVEKAKKMKLYNDKLLMKNEMNASLDNAGGLIVLGKMQMFSGVLYNGNILWDSILKEYRKILC